MVLYFKSSGKSCGKAHCFDLKRNIHIKLILNKQMTELQTALLILYKQIWEVSFVSMLHVSKYILGLVKDDIVAATAAWPKSDSCLQC